MSSSDSTSEINNGSVDAFLMQFAVTGATLLAFFTAFCILRPHHGLIYRPRPKLVPGKDFPELGSNYITWMWKLIRIPESKILECAGYDAAVYQRLAMLGVQVFTFCSIYGLCVLIPVYVTSWLSMGNVPPEDNATMVAPLISVYMFSIFAYWMLHRAYRDFQQLRLHYLSQKQPQGYTVMVSEMPKDDANDEAMTKLFNFTSHGQVEYAATAKAAADLQKAFDRREFYVHKLERALWDFKTKGNRPMHKTKALGLCGDKVDSIEFYTGKLDKYNVKVAELQGSGLKSAQTGFVTFKSISAAAAAPQVLYANNSMEYGIKGAPHPSDVYWPNMNIFGYELLTRRLIVSATVFGLVAFYTIPVAFIQGFMNMSTLESIFGSGFVDWINSLPGVQALLESLLPTLAMKIFLAILPPLCYCMYTMRLSKLEGWKALSTLERQQLIKLYYFQIFNVFLITALGSTFFTNLDALINDPTSVVDELATGLPNSANFFINYVMLLAFGGWGAALLQLVRLILVWVKLRWLAKTPYEREQAVNPGPFEYSSSYAQDLLVWAIGFTYATISPIILPFVIVYFAFGWFVNKYLTLYVNMPIYESGGKYFPLVFSRILVGMFVYQVMMVGIFSLKKSWIFFGLLPLPFATLVFYWLEHKMFHAPSKYIPLKLAREIDDSNQDAATVGDHVGSSIDRNAYIQPCLEPGVRTPETWDDNVDPDAKIKAMQSQSEVMADGGVDIVQSQESASALQQLQSKKEPQAMEV